VAGSKIPEDPSLAFEDVVSDGVVPLGVGIEALVSVVELSGGAESVDVELSGGVKPLVSVVLDDGDRSGVLVEFDRVVELLVSVQLKIEVMLERSVLFKSVESWLAGIRQVVVVVSTPDVTFETFVASVRLALDAPAVTFEIAEESVMVLLLTAAELEGFPIHAGGGVGISELRLARLIGLAVETADSTSKEKSPRESIEMNNDRRASKKERLER